MYLAIKHHHDKKTYPKTREDLINLSNSSTLSKTLETLNKIDNKNKEEMITVSQELLNYINSL